MSDYNLNLSYQNKKIKFKLILTRTIYGSTIYVFNTNKKIFASNDFLLEVVNKDNEPILFQVPIETEKIEEYFKDEKKYLQQIYIFDKISIIMRYDSSFFLKEIVYKIVN